MLRCFVPYGQSIRRMEDFKRLPKSNGLMRIGIYSKLADKILKLEYN